MNKIYEFEVEKINGDMIKLDEYEGKVMLIVNSATRCGFTPQYDDLQNLYEKYENQGFVVLEFPSNQFEQAPESDEEIAAFCDAKFGITFPRFAKIDVAGPHIGPLYQYLQSQIGFQGFDLEHPLTPMLKSRMERTNPNYENEPEVKWNFTKFLVDRSGNIVARFEPTTDMDQVEKCVRNLL